MALPAGDPRIRSRLALAATAQAADGAPGTGPRTDVAAVSLQGVAKQFRVERSREAARAGGPAPPPFERDVNTVFQDYALFPHMTVGENVAYGLMVRKVARPERDRQVAGAPAMG